MAFTLCKQHGKKEWALWGLFLQGHKFYWIGAPPFWLHLTLIASLEAPSPNAATLGFKEGQKHSVHNSPIYLFVFQLNVKNNFGKYSKIKTAELGLHHWECEQHQHWLIFIISGQFLIINTRKTFLHSYSDLRTDFYLNLKWFSTNMINSNSKLEKQTIEVLSEYLSPHKARVLSHTWHCS